MNVAELLTARARLTPERVALVDLAARRDFTFSDLEARAERAAGWLKSLGVQKGDRVALLAHNHVVYLDLLFGLARLGAIFAPLNWRLTAHELSGILADCEPRALLCGPEFLPVLEQLRPGLPGVTLVGMDGAVVDGRDYEAEITRALPAPADPSVGPEDPLCLLYTSGTTGRPKGALLPHRQVVWNCINTVVSWGLREDDVSPVLTPLFHAGGLFVFLLPLLYLGGRGLLARTFEAEASLRLIAELDCTVVLGVPTLFQLWRDTRYFEQADFSRVRFFINGGSSLPLTLLHAWRAAKPGLVIRQGYGLTEVGVNCFSMTDEESVRKAGTVGKPVLHSQARLLDPVAGREAPDGQPGELLLSGPHVCAGYWRDPEATALALRDGWFHTGDMAVRDADGFFTIVGRYKDMLKTGGENVYAAEVEAVFRDHPAVLDAALIGQPDEKWGETGLMVAVLRPGQSAAEADLLAFCQGRLAKFKIPKRVVFAETLPYSPYGKVEKARLKQQYLAG